MTKQKKITVDDIEGPIPSPGLPSLRQGCNLEWMMDLYSTMYESGFRQKENMPTPESFDLNPKLNQQIIRSICGFLLEELDEVYEAMNLAANTRESYSSSPSTDTKSCIKALNEELVDVAHFFMKLFVYLNIPAVAIKNSYEQQLKEHNLLALFDKYDTLATCLSVGDFQVNGLYPEFKGNLRFVPNLSASESFILKPDGKTIDPFLMGSGMITPVTLEYYQSMVLLIMSNLVRAQRGLTNKPWKSTLTPPNSRHIVDYVLQAWINFCGMVSMLGINTEGLATMFWYKNQVNLRRIKSDY